MKKFKDIFNTPQKTLLIVVIIIILIAFIGSLTTFAVTSFARSNSIGENVAAGIAFSDAKKNPSEIKLLKTDFEFDDGKFVYEIEFVADDAKYEYVIKASNGAIIEQDKDIYCQLDKSDSQNVRTKINQEEAKKIAFDDAKIKSSEVKFLKTEKDFDDGVIKYEIEFYTKEKEYDYEIDASTGEIISKNIEELKAPQDSYILIEDAEEIAAKHAGFNKEEIKFTKSGLDNDDGYIVYDIEFIKDTTKYEYEIDAGTGEILEFNQKTIKNN